jgi:hypothetical protein
MRVTRLIAFDRGRNVDVLINMSDTYHRLIRY